MVIVIPDSRSRLAAANYKGLTDTHQSLSQALDKTVQQRAGHEKEQLMHVEPQYMGKEQLFNHHTHST